MIYIFFNTSQSASVSVLKILSLSSQSIEYDLASLKFLLP